MEGYKYKNGILIKEVPKKSPTTKHHFSHLRSYFDRRRRWTRRWV